MWQAFDIGFIKKLLYPAQYIIGIIKLKFNYKHL